MADGDRPTLGEVIRRLEGVEKRLDGKLSRDVYDSDRKGDDARHGRTEKDVAQQTERLRTFFWGGAALLTALVIGNVVAKLMGF